MKPALTPETVCSACGTSSVTANGSCLICTLRGDGSYVRICSTCGYPDFPAESATCTCPDRQEFVAIHGYQEFRGDERRRMAADLLHGQPFGFTREDVAMLRECAKQQRDIEHDREASAYAGSLGYGDELESLAARIEALLHPEDK